MRYPDFPFTVAVIVAVPVLSARTSPFASTVATLVLLEDQVIGEDAERDGLNTTDVVDVVPAGIKRTWEPR